MIAHHELVKFECYIDSWCHRRFDGFGGIYRRGKENDIKCGGNYARAGADMAIRAPPG
jgi:hypothetical protein